MTRSVCSALLVGGWLLYASVAVSAPFGLAFVEAVRKGADGPNPLGPALAVSPDGANLYVVMVLRSVVFRVDAATGVLSFLQAVDTSAGGPVEATDVAVSPDGRHVYVTGFDNNSVGVYRRELASGLLTFVELKQDGVDGVDGLARALAVAASPDGGSVYVTGPGDAAVAVFSRDSETGALTFVEAQREGLNGAVSLPLSPDSKHLYVTTFDGVAFFGRELTNGALTFIGVERDGVGGVDSLAGSQGVAVSPDGKNVYVGTVFDHAVTVFSRNAATGELAQLEVHPASGVGVTPALDGSVVYVPLGDFALDMLERDLNTGRLKLLDRQGGLSQQRRGVDCGAFTHAAVTPDGRYVYADDERANLICIFQAVNVKCAATPMSGCHQPGGSGRSAFIYKNFPPLPDAKDIAIWKWVGAAGTSLEDFGSPASTTDYAICVYDASVQPQPQLSIIAPAGGSCGGRVCWKNGTDSVRYHDPIRKPDGLETMRIRAGATHEAAIALRARGVNLGVGFGLLPPVVVQAQNSAGGCWSATFSTPLVNDGNGVIFRAKSD